MPKQVIISMKDNYPFGECEQCSTQKTRVLVRKIYQVSLQQRNKLLEKVNILRKLKNEHMIKIQSVLEEEQSIHFLFQYIPIKLETWISNINDQFIQNFRDQLIKFSSFLANNYIKIQFQLRNIGMDHNYAAKYFLDLNFQVQPNINRQKLKSTYIREITTLFRPYILNSINNSQTTDNTREKIKHQENKSIQNKTKQQTNQQGRRRESAISPPTGKANPKAKQKALEKYYQQVNMSVDSQNQKILQEFMDVLDNEDEQLHPHQSKPAKPQPSTQPSKPQPSTQPSKHQPSTQPAKPPPTQSYPKQTQQTYHPTSINQLIYQSPSTYSPYDPKGYPQSTKFLPPSSQTSVKIQPQSKPKPKPSLYGTQSLGRVQSDPKWGDEFWRESAELQTRVKNAIEKSLNVIRKFKEIKDTIEI